MTRARLLACALLLVACGERHANVHQGRGVVRDVVAEYQQVVIEHEDIPGLMPAMTMNFDVADPAILARVEKGQAVEFSVEHDEHGYRIVALRVLGRGEAREGAPSLEKLAARLDPAPPFALTDQAGFPLALADLRGKAVVLDFIYTRCPGPCPIQTGIVRDVQQGLPPALRERAWFVSITLDPLHDSPARLAEHARARGLDLSTWSLLTGPPEQVEAVIRAYGVGSARNEDGTIDHLVATFLIDPEGRIAERYIGLEHEAEEIRADLARVAAAPAARP